MFSPRTLWKVERTSRNVCIGLVTVLTRAPPTRIACIHGVAVARSRTLLEANTATPGALKVTIL